MKTLSRRRSLASVPTEEISGEELEALAAAGVLPVGKATNGHALSTVTPAGIRALDPDAIGEGAPENGGGVALTVLIEQIEADPDQPRKQFDDAPLKALAESLRADGQITPVVVNVIHGDLGRPRYRLIDGERRFRAAKLAGLTELRVVARDLDPTAVLRLQGLANLEREDLNAIEQAEWCRRMTSPVSGGGGGFTQTQLAERLGVTQAEVSNRIRVLRAPAWARELIICGQMSRKHALALLVYEHAPTILKEAEEMTRDWLKRDGDLDNAEQFANGLARVAYAATAPITGSVYEDAGRGNYQHIEFAIELTPELRERLGLIEADWYEKGPRATNVKLAQKLLAEAKDAAKKKATAKADKKKARASTAEQELSPAEQKKREAEQEAQFAARLDRWYGDWLRWLCGRELSRPENTAAADARRWLAVWALFARPANEWQECEVALQLAGVKKKSATHVSAQLATLLSEHDGDYAWDLVERYVPRLLLLPDLSPRGETSGVNPAVPVEIVARLTKLLGIDPATAWRDDRESPLRELFWNLHSKDQLLALGKELNVSLLDTQKKSQMAANLLKQQRPLAMPAELAKLVKASGFRHPEGTRGSVKQGKRK